IDICNNHQDADNRITIKKSDVVSLLDKNDIDLEYSKLDQFFQKTSIENNLEIRFTLKYKYSYVECFAYYIFLEQDFWFGGRFNAIAKYQDEMFTEKVKCNLPIVSSVPEFNEVALKLIELHFEVVAALKLKKIC
ncbi:MAG: hypothetical protein GY694_15910, partial [Gammaproteobacteria bacterium]|nr:hypothetical protein [Gammaproteobacteria bacterium]